MLKAKITASIAALSAVAVSLLLISGFSDPGIVTGWITEEMPSESISRFNSVPILLYHDINGSGPFAISIDTLRSHFELFRNKNIRVIPLKELISSIESGTPFIEKTIAITFDDGFRSHYRLLMPLVREFAYPVTLFIYTDAIDGGILSWDNLRKMQAAGIDIQAHSVSHPDLTSGKIKSNSEQIFKELYLSKKLLELHLQKTVDFFAYPYGRYDLHTVELTKQAGYLRAFTTDYGTNLMTRDNFNIRRQHIKNSYTLEYIESLIE